VVTELPLTTAEITPGGPVSICTSEPVLLTSSSTTGNLWSTGETTQSITVTATGTVTLTVSGTCNNATDQVIIQPADVNAAFSVSDSIGFAPLQVNIVNESTNSASCAWFVNQTPSSAPETGSITFDTPGTYNITLECVSNNGCIDKETHIILIKPAEVTFWVPNTFSPNSDGKNEVFKAYGTGIERINAEIYNRWGIKIYEWNDFNEGWDGTMDGRVVQDDIYIYRFDVWDTNGKKFTTRGKILVLQNSASD
jgi:gliding motility-associated-like protein